MSVWGVHPKEMRQVCLVVSWIGYVSINMRATLRGKADEPQDYLTSGMLLQLCVSDSYRIRIHVIMICWEICQKQRRLLQVITGSYTNENLKYHNSCVRATHTP